MDSKHTLLCIIGLIYLLVLDLLAKEHLGHPSIDGSGNVTNHECHI